MGIKDIKLKFNKKRLYPKIANTKTTIPSIKYLGKIEINLVLAPFNLYSESSH